MAEPEGGVVNRQTFQVAYGNAKVDAPAVVAADAHTMDVQSLGPALVAFGRLIRETNAQINGNKSTVRVLVQSDFEHKCFNITFDVVHNILHQIATFLTGDEVRTAKEILEDLGVILGPPGLGLLGYLKWKNSREVSEVKDSDTKGVVIVQLGDGNVANVTRNAIELSKNVKVRNAIEGTLKPLGIDGIESINFKEGSSSISYTRDDATTIVSSFDIPKVETPSEEEDEGEGVVAFLRVYTLTFDEKVPEWSFLYEGNPIKVDISDTSIAADTVRRGVVRIDDLYKVRMNIRSHRTPTGQERFEYKLTEVISFTPAKTQSSLPL
jgi:hypothetical protein